MLVIQRIQVTIQTMCDWSMPRKRVGKNTLHYLIAGAISQSKRRKCTVQPRTKLANGCQDLVSLNHQRHSKTLLKWPEDLAPYISGSTHYASSSMGTMERTERANLAKWRASFRRLTAQLPQLPQLRPLIPTQGSLNETWTLRMFIFKIIHATSSISAPMQINLITM